MPADLPPRVLRCFLAVAEELHFTRAAARIPVAQQALSRDIALLERRLGAAVFHRTTRRVELTAAGARLLPLARRVVEAQRELAEAFVPDERPYVVDVAAPVSTGQQVLDAARESAPGVEFVARYHSGLARAAAEMADGRLDASFGRFAGLDRASRAGLGHVLVRYERVCVLLPEDDPRARLPEVPLRLLRGSELYAGAGNPETAEWTDYAEALVAGTGVGLLPPFPKIEGEAEFARLVRKRRWSVLASEVFVGVPGMVLRPLVEPCALSPVSLVYRRRGHPGLDALVEAARALGEREGWREWPVEGWVPEADARGIAGS
ncbi:LysR family transcriptional regulator [Streptomyces sulphureus]|uniref:LysR family transcriptional regulator n=1 Tax=Streptomyces sulphureus TaxID=47758 RepID=UPI000381A93A|nr:LysR family transcriptional regulator [Streptomyces sulphureus]